MAPRSLWAINNRLASSTPGRRPQTPLPANTSSRQIPLGSPHVLQRGRPGDHRRDRALALERVELLSVALLGREDQPTGEETPQRLARRPGFLPEQTLPVGEVLAQFVHDAPHVAPMAGGSGPLPLEASEFAPHMHPATLALLEGREERRQLSAGRDGGGQVGDLALEPHQLLVERPLVTVDRVSRRPHRVERLGERCLEDLGAEHVVHDGLQNRVVGGLERDLECVGADSPPALLAHHAAPERCPLAPVAAREHAHGAPAHRARREPRQQVRRVNAARWTTECAPLVASEIQRASGVHPLTRIPPQFLGHDAQLGSVPRDPLCLAPALLALAAHRSRFRVRFQTIRPAYSSRRRTSRTLDGAHPRGRPVRRGSGAGAAASLSAPAIRLTPQPWAAHAKTRRTTSASPSFIRRSTRSRCPAAERTSMLSNPNTRPPVACPARALRTRASWVRPRALSRSSSSAKLVAARRNLSEGMSSMIS